MTTEKEVDEFFDSLVDTETRLKRRIERGDVSAMQELAKYYFDNDSNNNRDSFWVQEWLKHDKISQENINKWASKHDIKIIGYSILKEILNRKWK